MGSRPGPDAGVAACRPGDRVGSEVTRHRRCWADHQTIADPAHAAAAADMRRSRRLIAVAPVEQRSLADMFDLDLRALKAPTLAGTVERLSERARAESWS
jgi:hypothetical protein